MNESGVSTSMGSVEASTMLDPTPGRIRLTIMSPTVAARKLDTT